MKKSRARAPKRSLLRIFVKLFGGCTCYSAFGIYKSETGSILTDRVKVIESFTHLDNTFESRIEQIIILCNELKKELKLSDVKILHESEVNEIKGELDEVEKVVIHDFDEDENYELFVDAVIILDYRN